MERVSERMYTDGAEIQLSEEITSREVEDLAQAVFYGEGCGIESFVGWSLLIPARAQRTADVPVKFFHRVFQEYFLTRALVRRNADLTAFPESVTRWAAIAREDVEGAP